MLIELSLALILGISIGIFTGLSPGIHINLVLVILLSISAFLLQLTSPIVLVVFIIAMSITHTYIDYIPSIFLGAPNEDTFLSILPGHQMLLMGNAYEALIITLYGSLTALPLILILTPVFIYLLPIIYPYITRIMPIILIVISFFLIISEKKKFTALFIFILAGILGLSVLNLNLKDPLLPLLTGLFGTSSLIISINQKTIIPKQEIKKLKNIDFPKSSFLKSTFASILASPFTAFLPGLGASQAAIISAQITEDLNSKEFLFTIGAIDTIVLALSFITLYSIQKTRSGASVAVNSLIPNLSSQNIFLIIIIIIISGIIAFTISMLLGKLFAKIIHKIPYTILSIIILLILIILTIYFTGFLGLLILIISTALGITCILLEIKRSHLMGCLLVPTILYYII